MSEQNLVVQVRLKADGSGLVGQLRPAIAETARLGATVAGVGADAGKMAAGTAAAAGAARELGTGAGAAATGVTSLSGSFRQTTGAATGLSTGAAELHLRLRALETANEQLAGDLGQARAAAAGFDEQLRQAQAATAAMAGKVDVLETRLEQLGGAHRSAGVSAGSHRQSVQMLGQQFSDFGTQVLGGISPMRAFTQQSGQVAFALSGMEGKAGSVGRFLAGPWGALVLIGVSAIGELGAKLWETSSAADGSKNKITSLADALGKAKVGTDAATQALRDYNAEQKKADDNTVAVKEHVLDLAEARLKEALATREQIKALIDKIYTEADAARGSMFTDSGQLIGAAAGPGQAALERQNALIDTLTSTIGNLHVELSGPHAEAAVDSLKAINQHYDRLITNAREAARGNAYLASKIESVVEGYERQRKSVVAYAQAQQQAAQQQERAAERQARTTTRIALPVSGPITSGFGARERPTAGASTNHPALDFGVSVGTPVKAGASGVVVYAGVLGGFGKAVVVDYGNGNIAQFSHLSQLKAGAGQQVGVGDVVGLSGNTGTSTGPHLDYRLRTGARFADGRVQGGRYVDPRSRVPVGDASEAAANYADQEARARQQAKEAADRVAAANKRAADELDRLNLAWGEQPTLIARAAADQAKLQAIIDAYADKEDEVSRAIVARAREEQRVIEEGKVRPLNDFLASQAEDLRVGALVLAGRQDEADALRVILQLERQMGPLTAGQRAEVLATVQALDLQARQLDVLRQKQGLYLDALADMKGIVADATDAFARGDLGQLIRTPKKLLDAFTQLNGRLLFERVFGETFRKLQDQVTGRDQVGQAADIMAAAVDRVSAQTDLTTGALGRLGDAATLAAGAVGAAAPGGGRGLGAAAADSAIGAALAAIGDKPAAEQTGPEVVVTGRRLFDPGQLGAADLTALARSAAAATNLLPRPRDPSARDLFGDGIGKVATSLAGVFTNQQSAEKIGASIGKFSGKALAGAATGQLVSGIGSALGLKLNTTGSSLGGAIGGVTGIPGGAIVGSLLGGLVGNLFAPKARPGGVTIGNAGGEAGQTGTSGSDRRAIAAAAGLGGAVSDGLNKIVDQLGGTLGAFNVSIGTYKGDLRVNENGRALGGVKNSGAYSFGEDEAAAVAKAISLAIGQGAVQGPSSAVARALQSSTDVDRALEEALKVAELEKVLGGIGAQLDAVFKTFDATAAERVTLAKKYGLDLLRVEQVNAEQRADLLDQTLRSRVGSLKELLTSLSSGDLFEGDAAARLAALQAQIDAAKKDAEAGKDGAADQLAQLERQKVQVARDSYGTAGAEYADARATAQADAQRVIDAETARINAAAAQAQATTASVDRLATLQNEQNDLTVETNQKLDAILDVLGDRGAAISPDFSLYNKLGPR